MVIGKPIDSNYEEIRQDFREAEKQFAAARAPPPHAELDILSALRNRLHELRLLLVTNSFTRQGMEITFKINYSGE